MNLAAPHEKANSFVLSTVGHLSVRRVHCRAHGHGLPTGMLPSTRRLTLSLESLIYLTQMKMFAGLEGITGQSLRLSSRPRIRPKVQPDKNAKTMKAQIRNRMNPVLINSLFELESFSDELLAAS